jgi:hypothetical protein
LHLAVRAGCALEDQSARASLCASAKLTGGLWWRTFAFTPDRHHRDPVWPAPRRSDHALDPESLTFLIDSLIYAIIVAYAAIALTVYSFDLQARPAARCVKS